MVDSINKTNPLINSIKNFFAVVIIIILLYLFYSVIIKGSGIRYRNTNIKRRRK
jgi:hypothetical protein